MNQKVEKSPTDPFARTGIIACLLKAFPVPALVAKASSGRILLVNHPLEMLLRRPAAEIETGYIGTLFSDSVRVQLQDSGNDRISMQAALRRDGVSLHPVELSQVQLVDLEDPAFLLMIRPVVPGQQMTGLPYATAADPAGGGVQASFLAQVSHELRTPLNAIIGFAEVMQEEVFGPIGNEKYREYVGDVLASGRHLKELVDEVLQFTQLEAGRAELREMTVNVRDEIELAVRLLLREAVKVGVGLETDIQPNLPQLRADPRKLRQVLLNLVANAVKFTPSGKQVCVYARRRNDGGIELSVVDSGVGIPSDKIDVVLEPFGQVSSPYIRDHDGLGLGLPLSKQLVELHGGTLDIYSDSRVGTAVTAIFPPERSIWRKGESGGIETPMDPVA